MTRLLDWPHALDVVDRYWAATRAIRPVPRRFPARLFQYWDAEPPRQVTALLHRCERCCRAIGFDHVLFDDRAARDFLAGLDPVYRRAYDAAPHPAMKSDLIRLCFLYREGGAYLDADMVLRDNAADLLDFADTLLVAKWTSHGRRNLPNWFFAAPAGHPFLDRAMTATARSILDHCATSPQTALKGILQVSGPGLFTRAFASHVHGHVGGRPAGIRMIDAMDAYRFVQNGPDFLGQPLDYKAGDRHWLVAGRAGPPDGPSGQ